MGEDTQTNAQVDQFFAVVPFDQQFSSLFAALTRHMQEEPNDYKVSCSGLGRETCTQSSEQDESCVLLQQVLYDLVWTTFTFVAGK